MATPWKRALDRFQDESPHEDSAPPPYAVVTGIQACMPSSKEIRGASVIAVETLEELNSPKMGISDIELPCETCGSYLDDCPGHSGSMEFPIPVYRIHFTNRLCKILNCVCFYCHRPRLPKCSPDYEYIMSLEPKHRLEQLVLSSARYKHCGDVCRRVAKGKSAKGITIMDPDDYSVESVDRIINDVNRFEVDRMNPDDIHECGRPYIQFSCDDNKYTFIKPTIPLDRYDEEQYELDPTWTPATISPQDILDCLHSLDENAEFLEMIGSSRHNLPSSHMFDVLPVPSNNTRPSHKFGGIGGDRKCDYNDFTKYLRCILQCRNKLRTEQLRVTESLNVAVYSVNELKSPNFKVCFEFGFLKKDDRTAKIKLMKSVVASGKGGDSFGSLESLWRDLHKAVAAFHSLSHKSMSPNTTTYGKAPTNVVDRLKNDKSGRVRGNMIAGRVNFAFRGVLDGDVYLRPSQMGVPKRQAMNLTVKTYCTERSKGDIQALIMNGPYEHPGANYAMMKGGKEIHLQFHENRRDIDIEKVLYVRRHIQNGDTVIGNRQPTLHRPSMMSFEVKIIDGYAIRMHPSVFGPMGADCDGDEVNGHIPQDVEAIAECRTIMAVKNQIMKDGKVWINFIQNSVVGAWLMTQKDVFFTREEAFMRVGELVNVWSLPFPAILRPVPRWTGLQLISLLFPKDFNVINANPDAEGDEDMYNLLILNGQMLTGRLNASMLNGSRGILHHMCIDYTDKDLVVDMLYEGYLFFQNYLDKFGLTAGYFDTAIDPNLVEMAESQPDRYPEIKEAVDERKKIKDYSKRMEAYADTFYDHNPAHKNYDIEISLREHLDRIHHMSEKNVMKYFRAQNRMCNNSNGVLHMIESGGKGSTNTMNQMAGEVGQVYTMCERFSGTSSHFRKGKDALKAHGYISSSYSEGIDARDHLTEAPATGVSIVDKNRGTANSGYTVRKMASLNQSNVTNHFGQVIDTGNRVMWETYGGDGYDPKYLCNTKLRLVNFKEWDVLRRYAIMFCVNDVVKETESKSMWNKIIAKKSDAASTRWVSGLNISETTNMVHLVESIMSLETYDRWSLVKDDAATRTILKEETMDLLRLRRNVIRLLSRSHETMDISDCKTPINFSHLFTRCESKFPGLKKSPVDLHPLEYHDLVTRFWERLVDEKCVVETNVTLHCLFMDYFSTRSLMIKWRFGEEALLWLFRSIANTLGRCRVDAGESVGMDAAQTAGEYFTQMSLKSPHQKGKKTGMVTGAARMSKLIDGIFLDPSMRIVMSRSVTTRAQVSLFAAQLTRCYIRDILKSYPKSEFLDEETCRITFVMDRKKIVRRCVSLRNIPWMIQQHGHALDYDMFSVPFLSEDPYPVMTLTVRTDGAFWKKMTTWPKSEVACTKESNAANIVYNLYKSVSIHGRPKIVDSSIEELTINTPQGKKSRWGIYTTGSDLAHVLTLANVDCSRTVTNDINEMCRVLGLNAARMALTNEFMQANVGSPTDPRHTKLLVRMMTLDLDVRGLKGVQTSQIIPPMQRAAFEQCVAQMVNYCGSAEFDNASTVCGSAFANKPMAVGTGYTTKVISTLASTLETSCVPFNDRVFSPKGDGTRYLLSFYTFEKVRVISLTDRRNEVRIFPSEHAFPESLFHGTVLDGEMVVTESLGVIFMVFDCLMSCGNRSTSLRYDQRVDVSRKVLHFGATNHLEPSEVEMAVMKNDTLWKSSMSTVLDLDNVDAVDMGADKPYIIPSTTHPEVSRSVFPLGDLPFRVTVKPIFSCNGVADYESTMQHKLFFGTDGYVFTHIKLPYYPFLKSGAIYKWKPQEGEWSENTIDFEVKTGETALRDLGTVFTVEKSRYKELSQWSDDVLTREEVQSFRVDGGEYGLIVANPGGTRFDFTTAKSSVEGLEDGDVVECRWHLVDHYWDIFRKRDKSPNQWFTVVRTLQNIKEDIKVEEL